MKYAHSKERILYDACAAFVPINVHMHAITGSLPPDFW